MIVKMKHEPDDFDPRFKCQSCQDTGVWEFVDDDEDGNIREGQVPCLECQGESNLNRE